MNNSQFLTKRSHSKVITAFLIATMFLVLVFPNAFRIIKVVLFVLILLIIKPYFAKLPQKVRSIYLLGSIITFIYIIVGLSATKAPGDSTLQVGVVYILSPLFWLTFSFYVIKNYSIEAIVKMLNYYAIIGSITVLIGIWLYNHGYKNILSFVIENPNETFSDSGVSAIRFHVYGSLIFLYPALLQIYNKFKGVRYVLLLVLLVVITIVSGRDALILSIIIGFILFIILGRGKFIKYGLYLIPAAFILFLLLQFYGVNLTKTLSLFYEKVKSGGGNERSQQFFGLLDGIGHNYLLGSGHGVGISLIRSNDYPWRYEMLPMATIFRVGMLGFIIYSLPAIISTKIFLKKFFEKKNTIYDNYFFAGLISLCLASFTNPYLESFEFQWGYFFVFIYFISTTSVASKIKIKITTKKT